MSGFSKTNLLYCRKLYQFYSNQVSLEIGEQVVHQFVRDDSFSELISKIPWDITF